MDISGTVSLDSKLADCVVGQEKQITLTVTPTKNDSSGFEADVSALEEYDEESSDQPADASGSEESDSGSAPMAGKGGMMDKAGMKGGMPSHVIMVALGKAKK